MHPVKFLFRMALLAMACAAAAARAEPVKFDLPAQPLATALAGFAKQAGVEALYSFDALKSVPANPVIGVFEPEEALAQLLRGTGFIGTRIAPRKFIVVRERTAEVGVIKGRVVAPGGEPIAGALVRALGSTLASRTDAHGAFMLPGVPVETPGIVVQADGFATTRVADMKIAPGRRTDFGEVRLRVREGMETMDELVISAVDLGTDGMPFLALERVVVSPSRFGLDQERGLLAATLTETELQSLPQLGEDLYRAIARLPGLAADDYTARFWVRGAPYEQVLARLDGVDLIEPFHLKDTDSSLAVIDLESINRLALYTGGFTAEYGNRLAGVLTMETDSHVRAQSRTSLGLSLTGARIGSRGQTENGRSRWLVSGRLGIPDVAFETDNDTKLKMRYYDAVGKWEFDVAPGHTLSLHALHAGDRGDYSEAGVRTLRSRYNSDYLWARWQGSYGQWKGETVLSYAELSSRRNGARLMEDFFPSEVDETSELRVFALRQDGTVGWSERALLRGGVEFKRGNASYDYRGFREVNVLRDGVVRRETRSRASEAEPEGMSAGGYVSARMQPWAALTMEPGVRYDWNDYADDSDVSPRLSAALSFGRSTVRAAWGLYHQMQGLHELAARDGDLRFYRSERAEHRVLSFEHRLPARINLRLEAYERRVSHPRVRWGNVISNVAAFPEWSRDRVRFDPVRQAARGLELVAERRIGEKWSWSGSYAWANSEETLRSGTTVPRARDQRHTLYLDVAYTPNPRWEFSAAWQSHTGWPTTDLDISRATLPNGQTIVTTGLAPLYASRLPSYQRLDCRAQRRFDLKRGALRVYVDVFNVLEHDNVIEYDYDVRVENGQVAQTRIPAEEQLTRLFTVGVTWDF